MKKKGILLLTAVVMATALTGCSGGGSASYKDGQFQGQSTVYQADADDDDADEAANGYGVVMLTIKDGKITECTYQTYEENGTLKDENYGKEDGEIKNKDYYNKAQKAAAACAEYAQQLVDTGKLDDVDVISGATINYNEFKEAVKDALAKATE